MVKPVSPKRWTAAPQPAEATTTHLQQTLGIRPALARLIAQRGLTTYEEAYAFFNPAYEATASPFRMQGMQQAVERISNALQQQEPILVFGDYDVDGTTAVAMLYRYLGHLTDQLYHYVPDRFEEGYGLSYEGIDYGLARGVSLMIVLDCGIKGHDYIAYASEHGMDVIIGDHHTPGEALPPAHTILNPKQQDCPYPYKELSGCGIGFKLIQALHQQYPQAPDPQDFLDFVAVSTAADIVEMKDENRVLACHGLQKLNDSPNPAFEALKEVSGLEKALTIQDLVFKIGPRINAAGRVTHASNAVELLMADDKAVAVEKAKPMNDDNAQRQQFDRSIRDEILERIEGDRELASRYTTVLFNENWHKGVIGIVASRVMEHYYRPTILFTESNGTAVGSGRSVPGFDMYEALEACSDLLYQFGGHVAAAGMTVQLDQVEAFAERFEQVVRDRIDPELLVPTVSYDLELNLKDIDWKWYRSLQRFAPFGPGNLEPVFMTAEVYLHALPRVVGNNHLKLQLKEEEAGEVFDAIAFSQGDQAEKLSMNQPFAICYQIEANTFNGRTTLQLNIKDLKPAT